MKPLRAPCAAGGRISSQPEERAQGEGCGAREGGGGTILAEDGLPHFFLAAAGTLLQEVVVLKLEGGYRLLCV